MTTFKLSVVCDTIEEFQRVASLLLEAKGVQNVASAKDPDGPAADNRGGGEVGTRDQGKAAEPAAEAPKEEAKPEAAVASKSRGRPKKKPAADLTLPGTSPAVTLAVVAARAKLFAKQWGAPSLVEILKAFNAKTTTDLKPDQYEAIMKSFDEFTMGEDEPEDDAEAEKTNEDPFNDLL